MADNTLKQMHIEVLQAMMRESIQVVENVELDGRVQKADYKHKVKEAQIGRLREQVVFRDELIDEARRMLRSAGVTQSLDDRRIVDINDLYHDGQVVIGNKALESGAYNVTNRNVNNSKLSNNSPQKKGYPGTIDNDNASRRRNLLANGIGQRKSGLDYVNPSDRVDKINARNRRDNQNLLGGDRDS